VLTVTALTDGEYVLSSVALGIDEYYAGVGEAPGVWSGVWSLDLGVEGMVEADPLRALIDGNHPVTGLPLLVGLRERSVKAFDLTFSAPKSVSLLWALGSVPIADTVMAAHRDAVGVALGFLEEHAATARLQVDGVRRHVGTNGWAVAEFVHRTSREGDPQLHTHCLVPNVVQREADGRCVALAARPLFVWARAAGSVYQAELQRSLALRLGVEWGPDRSNTRDLVGLTPAQLRAFSKRSVEIEAELEAGGARYDSPALRMQADDEASLATRPAKDHSLTPSLLADRWHTEAAAVDLDLGGALDRAVCWRDPAVPPLTYDQVVRSLVDGETGLCAHSPRFAEPDVVEHVAALSAGRLTVDAIRDVAGRFLGSEHVVRLVPARSASGWEPARWSTAAHRALEDETLTVLDGLQARPGSPVAADTIDITLAAAPELGADQGHAVEVLCGPGGAVRAVLAPAGYGKTAMVHAAAMATVADGRPVVAVATTARAVAELAEAGVGASTIARFRVDLDQRPLVPGTVVVLDEISQTSTRDAHAVLAAVAACPGGQLWVLGDPRQAPAVKAGGIAAELDARAAAGGLPAATLAINRRQVDPVDREALGLLRAGDPASSQRLRTAHGWEHEAASPHALRSALADAVVAEIFRRGAATTALLVVTHGQAEDLADRIRQRLTAAGVLSGPGVTGPGWTADRHYQSGDRVLFHTRCGDRHSPLVNGTGATITAVDRHGLIVRTDDGDGVVVPLVFVRGRRRDGSPNLSHAWARTVDGAQGGTWDHVHLLGSAALDAYRGYTGQSRSRHPTHTWNTSLLDDGDHGGRLADRRGLAQQVAEALARVPDTTLAAVDDPWPTHRRLCAVIDAHQAVLDRRPPDRTQHLATARAALETAQSRLAAARAAVVQTQHRVDDLGPLNGVTRAGRAKARNLDEQLLADQRAAVDAGGAVTRAHAAVARLERHQQTHDRFAETERWRHDAITTARTRLAQHWTDVALACVRADQPLAYGVEPLRIAHYHLAQELAVLDASLSTNRQPERDAARGDLTGAITARRAVARELLAAREEHAVLVQQHWPRRDSAAIGRAADRLADAQTALEQAHADEHAARVRLDALDNHQHHRRQALDATASQRQALSTDVGLVDAALDRTRPDRVLDLARQRTPDLVRLLGPVPNSIAGHAVWCHAANRLEAHLDYDSRTGPEWERLCRDVAGTPQLCAIAHEHLDVDRSLTRPYHWAHVAETARTIHEELISTQHVFEHRGLERGIGIDLGL
jgi:conjugative relaxase-like TrwC/TraI family protein